MATSDPGLGVVYLKGPMELAPSCGGQRVFTTSAARVLARECNIQLCLNLDWHFRPGLEKDVGQSETLSQFNNVTSNNNCGFGGKISIVSQD